MFSSTEVLGKLPEPWVKYRTKAEWGSEKAKDRESVGDDEAHVAELSWLPSLPACVCVCEGVRAVCEDLVESGDLGLQCPQMPCDICRSSTLKACFLSVLGHFWEIYKDTVDSQIIPMLGHVANAHINSTFSQSVMWSPYSSAQMLKMTQPCKFQPSSSRLSFFLYVVTPFRHLMLRHCFRFWSVLVLVIVDSI